MDGQPVPAPESYQPDSIALMMMMMMMMMMMIALIPAWLYATLHCQLPPAAQPNPQPIYPIYPFPFPYPPANATSLHSFYLSIRSAHPPPQPSPHRRHFTQVMLDPLTQRSRGYGFVRFGSEAERDRAIAEMNGVYVSTRQVRVSLATAKRAGAPGGAPPGSTPGVCARVCVPFVLLLIHLQPLTAIKAPVY